MIHPHRIVVEARSWVGTPYQHQCSTRGAGTDCLGLVRGVWRAVLGPEPETVPPYTDDWAEPAGQEVLLSAALRCLRPKALDAAAPGDVLLFRMTDRAIAKHLGIQSDLNPARFIHAYTGHGVIECPLSQPWDRRIVARFAYPEGAL
jgi:NlpC/P60 family putative phage cell wall peptidase